MMSPCWRLAVETREERSGKTMERVLIVDDDAELCAMVAEYLKAEGFEVEAVHKGEGGAQRVLADGYVLVILDVMLPDGSGFDVLRRIRARSRTPVLMLTARGEDVDRIVGLELGADDYLPKPFHPRELVARIRAILRRSAVVATTAGATPPGERLVVGDVEVDTATHTARCQGEVVELTTMEFNLLLVLLRKAGLVVSREELFREVLGREFEPYDRSLDVHVSNLRRKLDVKAGGAERIKAIRGVGYFYVHEGRPKRKK
jgi:two-component system response regulator CpxR